jgi:hypothetical protein
MDDKKWLFIDMDGTLTKFTPVDTLEKLYQEGWFRDQEPQRDVVAAVKELVRDHDDKVEVYILTSYLEDSKYAFSEKQEWLNEHLPEIDDAHRIYVRCGDSKANMNNWRWPSDIYDKNNPAHGENIYMRGRFWQHDMGDMSENHLLLDDYTKNLIDWDPPGRGLKLLNGINHTHRSWAGDTVLKTDIGLNSVRHALLSAISAESAGAAFSGNSVISNTDEYGQITFNEAINDLYAHTAKTKAISGRIADKFSVNPFSDELGTITEFYKENCKDFSYDEYVHNHGPYFVNYLDSLIDFAADKINRRAESGKTNADEPVPYTPAPEEASITAPERSEDNGLER